MLGPRLMTARCYAFAASALSPSSLIFADTLIPCLAASKRCLRSIFFMMSRTPRPIPAARLPAVTIDLPADVPGPDVRSVKVISTSTVFAMIASKLICPSDILSMFVRPCEFVRPCPSDDRHLMPPRLWYCRRTRFQAWGIAAWCGLPRRRSREGVQVMRKIFMRGTAGAILLAGLAFAESGSYHAAPAADTQSPTAGSAATVETGVRDFMRHLAHEVTEDGPAAWHKYFADTPAFFMAVNGKIAFASGTEAMAGLQQVAAAIKQI